MESVRKNAASNVEVNADLEMLQLPSPHGLHTDLHPDIARWNEIYNSAKDDDPVRHTDG